MLCFLCVLLGAAAVLSGVGVLSYRAGDIAGQAVVLAGLCWVVNILLARAVRTPPNLESSLITGLILSAIVGPFTWPQPWLVLVVMALAASVSKYVLVFRHRHIFNPAAVGALAGGLFMNQPASWWIGAPVLLPVVLAGGWFMVQKLRRWHLVFSFLGVYLGLVGLDALLVQGRSLLEAGMTLYTVLTVSPLLFFAFVMLVEPLTAPRTVPWRMIFGALVAVMFFALPRLVGDVPHSLELSLLIGNVAAVLMGPVWRQTFVLSRQERLASAGNFWFKTVRPFAFTPGQFLEYTLAHRRPDARGVRRYYTIASSPTEKEVLLTTRFSSPSSSFKRALRAMAAGDEIVASKVAGDFVLPPDLKQKLAWLAGGIGITPFRSMVKYLLDTNQPRDIVLLYAARGAGELVFREIFEEARARFGLRTVCVLADADKLPAGWAGRQGMVDELLLREAVPDFRERWWYISGPEPMVQSLSRVLRQMKVARAHIKRDYFPGYPS